MSSPANTSISFQPTDTAGKDKRQTNLTSVGKNPLSFVNTNMNIKATKDNVTDARLHTPVYCARNVIPTEEEEQNDDTPFKG